ncbi:hypothetical protein EAT51_19950 [Pseudoxanthomonas winnipegensis]|uniref:hypothetical protein n=1 Tax=Pseudoxanthomonas winnipegensis TaxID=2480810 RepID=UPI00102D9B76|nr:hypothetical protein [Pseudoxanthomonas winnipegensis]TAA36377.1 hypothetical protein EAT51_19745 [Pseudoxanthomonas winnipegensis]TAA36410.1 hypothetical protein EAT51_19950 [Pseudoxanthomonas winnipegensis]
MPLAMLVLFILFLAGGLVSLGRGRMASAMLSLFLALVVYLYGASLRDSQDAGTERAKAQATHSQGRTP